MKKILGLISIFIPTVLTVLIINFLFDIVSLKIQGLPIIMPFVLCPIGAVFGFIGYRINKDKIALVGIIFNIVLFIFPILYHVLGTLIGGV